MLKPIIGGYGTPKFVEKTFTGGSKTAKFVKVFSLESFPLCGTSLLQLLYVTGINLFLLQSREIGSIEAQFKAG